MDKWGRINLSTGEIFEDSKPAPKYGSKQFWKLYMKDFLKVLRVFNNKQLDVFAYILEKTQQSTNMFNGTYRSISKACNVSLSTVTEVMKLLQDSGFIKKLQNGSYIVSPNVLVKGDERKRGRISHKYASSTGGTSVAKGEAVADTDGPPAESAEFPKEDEG